MDAPVWVVASQVRGEERRLLDAFAARGVAPGRIDPRTTVFDPGAGAGWAGRVVLNREISAARAGHVAQALHADGATVINSPHTTLTANDKWRTYLALRSAGVATVGTRLAVSPGAALRAGADLDLPLVVKPLGASHGNRVSLARDRYALEAILEHCEAMPTGAQRMVLLQEYLGARRGDLRMIVLAGRCLGAVERRGESDWRNNVARGAQVRRVPLTAELEKLALSAARAVDGFFVGIDVLHDDAGRPRVLEVNAGTEFTGFEATGQPVAEAVVDACLARQEEIA